VDAISRRFDLDYYCDILHSYTNDVLVSPLVYCTLCNNTDVSSFNSFANNAITFLLSIEAIIFSPYIKAVNRAKKIAEIKQNRY
jgi:hypothetical protein